MIHWKTALMMKLVLPSRIACVPIFLGGQLRAAMLSLFADHEPNRSLRSRSKIIYSLCITRLLAVIISFPGY
jgi:hypothetical protein